MSWDDEAFPAPRSAKSIAQLRELSDADLIAQHDYLIGSTQVGTGYYRDELVRRETERATGRMERLTKIATGLTVANLLLAAGALVAAICSA